MFRRKILSLMSLYPIKPCEIPDTSQLLMNSNNSLKTSIFQAFSNWQYLISGRCSQGKKRASEFLGPSIPSLRPRFQILLDILRLTGCLGKQIARLFLDPNSAISNRKTHKKRFHGLELDSRHFKKWQCRSAKYDFFSNLICRVSCSCSRG